MNKSLKLPLLIFILYLITTISEVLVHKHIMHNNDDSFIRKLYGDSHIKHHKDVKHDMKLRSGYHNEGLYFSWSDSLYVSILTFILWYPVILLFYKFKWQYMIILSLFVGVIYKKLWDFLHFSFHQVTELEAYKSNPIYYWYFHNHAMHHLVKGEKKGNYNIIIPGGDYILGYYNTSVNNKEFCKKNKQHNYEICRKEANNEPLEHGFKWE
tara:strand:+ start:998 stop:1630 length:633 start_codon:yes stop_codon:yes gene_type:complete